MINENELDNNEMILVENGLLVPIEENEKVKREFLFSQMACENTLNLVITVTEKCNFVCKYCAQDFNKGKMSEIVQENLLQFVRKNISNYNQMRVEWFGGEPLLCLDIIEKLSESFIKICRQAKKGYTATITTNGYLLDLNTFKILLKNKVIAYQITLDGLKKEHDKQRCLTNENGTYERILTNLIDIKNNVNSGIFRINIRTNFTKEIVGNINNYLRFYEKTFEGDTRFVFFARAAEDWGGDRVKDFEGLLTKEQEKLLLEQIYDQDPKLNFFMNYAFLEPRRTICHVVAKNMFNIGCDGKVYKCDSSIDIACIGEIEKGGKLNVDEYKIALWTYGTRYNSPECDECFFSCSLNKKYMKVR